MEAMTQGETGAGRGSRIALALAVALALGAIGWRGLRGTGPEGLESGQVVPAATGAGDQLAAFEARTREDPGDAEAWSQLAAALFEGGRFAEAASAFGHALALKPATASLWSSRGEALVMASDHDPLPRSAVADFEKAIAIDPKDPRARYFLAVRRDLDGDHAGAIADWLALLEDTPPGAAWQADLKRTIEQVGKINGIPVAERLAAMDPPPLPASPALAAIPGPSAEDLRRAAALRPSDQQEMAQGMVARLEGRLRGEPTNVDGWIMLIRSRVTLGESDKARQALEQAVRANPGRAEFLRDQAAQLGIR